MATSSSATMKTSLVLMLLLSAVVASHGHLVHCKNSCKKPIIIDDITIDLDVSISLDVKDVIKVAMFDKKGKKHVGKYKCPKDVKALEFIYVDLCVKAKITGITFLEGLVHSVLGGLTTIFGILL